LTLILPVRKLCIAEISKEKKDMPLREEYEATGNWLFKRRSYVPVLFFGLALFSLRYYTPLKSELADQLWEVFCLFVSFSGLAIRILTVGYTPRGTSGRNTRGQVASVLNTTGIYSLTRHPLYLGNFLMWFGVSLFPRLWWFSALCLLMFWVYYERIMFAEEAFLREKFGKTYVSWASRTSAFIPSFKNGYVKPHGSFSWKKIFRKEYNGFLAVILCFFSMEILGDYLSGLPVRIDVMWAVILGLAVAAWLVLRAIKHWTSALKAEDDQSRSDTPSA
jgi:protein-S-isoprenylcysteine O-methyltransferase Ste14